MHGPRTLMAATTATALLLALPGAGAALDGQGFDPAVACPADEVPERFTDVTPPHGPAADCLAWHGLAAGTGPTTYEPLAPVTRAQTASLVHRLLGALDGVALPDAREDGFADVDGVHADAIESLAALDPPILRGYGDGTFGPQRSVTRGQIATVTVGALDAVADQVDGLAPLPEADAPYDDVADSAHEEAIGRLHDAGVVRGYGDDTFRPDADVTRGELATVLSRVAGAMVEAGLLALPDPRPDLDVALRLDRVAQMASPTAGTVGPDGTVYLAERAGTVHALGDDGIGPALVDVSDDTTTDVERGLLGLAFAPDGSELYLSRTDAAGDTLVEAVAVDDGVPVAEDRRAVYALAQPYANHNGGDLRFGPDDMLYLGLGDGGGSGDPEGAGQDLSTPLGSLVRIDPLGDRPYRVPDDNPFVGDPDAADEIFAYGLRNPWRFSFDRDTGDLWIADVGENEREEINWLPAGTGAGANLGWSLMEGTRTFAGDAPDDHVPPVYEYDTGGPEGCAITGGFVYRGTAIPELRGAYLYSDFCEGAVRGLVLEGGEVTEQADLGIAGDRVVSFVEDGDGELYVLGITGGVDRIVPADG